jgi:sirohydrochlorin ferrochelatase
MATDSAEIVLTGSEGSPLGLVIVDHGSRREESNAQIVALAEAIAAARPELLVEPAHMELAEPSLAAAFANCVARGARLVVVHPYFLAPGSHWDRDIPALAAQAAKSHPGVRYLVTAPLGPHPLLMQIVFDRFEQCLRHAMGEPGCDLCRDTDKCKFMQGA